VVSPTVAQGFALILHELATNAAKYGALSGPQGQVEIKGAIERIEEKEVFAFHWIETGGPKVAPPTRKGFGTSVLADVPRQFCQDVTVQYDPAGLVYTLRAQVGAIAAPLTDQPNAS
jgi:two-component sensor histidine kinase